MPVGRLNFISLQNFTTCTHQIELDCGRPVSKEQCPELCGMLLDCHHICNLRCHKRSSHEKIDCRQPCLKAPCPEKHPCPKECFQDCEKCLVDVIKKLPCGHDVSALFNHSIWFIAFLNQNVCFAGEIKVFDPTERRLLRRQG